MEHSRPGSARQDIEPLQPHQIRSTTAASQARIADLAPSRRKGKGGVDDVAVCASPGDFRRKRRKARGEEEKEALGTMLRKGVVEHQLGLSLNLILLVAFSWLAFPRLRETTAAFFRLSYPLSAQAAYGLGPKDLYLVAGFVVFFTAVRAACLDYVLLPLAEVCGIRKPKGRVRFAEQAYLLLYYLVFWTGGVYLFVQDTPSGTSSVDELLISLWRDFPRLSIRAGMKLYYLSQTAFWVQQIFVINIEERRKDHWQMLTHHLITVGLLGFSFCYRQMRAGNAVLVLMDVVDLILPVAKILRYMGAQIACDATFGLFVVLWLAARHIGYMAVCWSIYKHVNSDAMLYGTYSTLNSTRVSPGGGNEIAVNLLQPLFHPAAETVSFNANIRWLFLEMLLVLQVITIAWFVLICRVVARVIRGEGADDSRSDEEDEDEDGAEAELSEPHHPASTPFGLPEEQAQAQAGAERPRFIEIEASSEDIRYSPAAKSSGSRRKAKGLSSGLHLGEHKEILNRIGCLSDEQLAREREKREGSGSPRPGSRAKGGK